MTKWFSKDLLAIEMKKTKVKTNKPVYLGLSILEISKKLMYDFWYDFSKNWCMTFGMIILNKSIEIKRY